MIVRCSIFIFKENHVFIEEEDNSSDKVVMVVEELDGIDIDVDDIDIHDIGNLVDLPSLIFIDEECGNFNVVDDDGELTVKNNRNKSSEVLQTYRC